MRLDFTSFPDWSDGRRFQELFVNDGRDDWIRTSDPHNPIVVRYQTAPRPADQIHD